MPNCANRVQWPSRMRQSQLFTKTRREAPKDEVAKNAELLIRAGYVHKEMAGVYSYLPLGLRVIEKIKNIIREELDTVGAQELVMTTLQPKDLWEASGRWDDSAVDDWFKTELKSGGKLGLAFTHEEPLTNIMRNYISSYKDLPVYAYQFQTKFRNELRAKSGIMRGKEFVMKDLYDFSRDRVEHEAFYEKMKGVYMAIFARMGLGARTFLTISSGGSFSKYSYEFQTLTDAGEDVILYDEEKKISINKVDYSDALLKDFGLNKKDLNLKEAKSVEVGDIYSLGEKFSKALGLTYKDENGKDQHVYMGSYGIGIPRLMGTIVEVFADEKGIVWPASVAPFDVHLVELSGKADDVKKEAEELYRDLSQAGIAVLWDDRDLRAGEKFADSELIGVPLRVVVSEKTLAEGKYECVDRATGKVAFKTTSELVDEFTD